MRTETVPVIVGALGLIREGMGQNLGKIPGASNINELMRNGAHTEKVSQCPSNIKLPWYLRTMDWPRF